MNFNFFIKNKIALIGVIIVIIVVSLLLARDGALDISMIDKDEIEIEELNKDIEMITQGEVFLDEIYTIFDEITVE